MSTALLCLAAALAVAPAAPARYRLRGLVTGTRWAPARFPAPLGRLALAAVTALVVAVISTPLVGGLAGGCAALAGRAWSSSRRTRREQAELAWLAEALGALAAELRAGRSIDAAVEAAATGTAEEAGARLVRAIRLPRPAATPAAPAAPGAVPAALDRVSAAVLLSGRTGCSLAEVVGAVEEDLRARMRQAHELRSVTAAPRAGATLLAGLPVLGLAMGAGVGADPWGVLTTTSVGQVLLVLGVALEVAGVVWSGRLVRRAAR